MNTYEIIEKYFSKDFIEENSLFMEGIISYVQNCKGEFILKDGEVSLDDVIKRKEDSNYKLDNTIKLINNGLEVSYAFKSFWDEIKNYIPKSITKITLPNNIDIKDLELFPNLNTLELGEYSSIEFEELKYLRENTNIKDIYVSFLPFNKDIGVVFARTNNLMVYSDIKIHRKEEKKSYDPNELEINASSFDEYLLDELINNTDMTDIKRIEISTTTMNSYKIDIKENKNIEIKIVDKNLDIACDLYDYFTNRGYNVNKITSSIIYKKDDFFNEEKVSYVDYNFDKLDELNKKTDLNVSYNASFVSTGSYSDFKGLVESVKWFRNIINDYPLSPLEKLAFAYDIMKTFQYNESKNDLFDSRYPSRIIETGNIVCVGYTALLSEIIDDIDSNIKLGNFTCSCYEDDDKTLRGNHSRAIVYINDDKYNVHGIYVLDPTWDSVKRNGKEVLGESYNALSLYHYFLIPFKEYETVFKHDSKPEFFKGKIEELNTNLTSEKINEKITELDKSNQSEEGELPQEEDKTKLFGYELRKLLENISSPKDIIKAFDNRRLTFEEFLSLIRNVRMVEGFHDEYLENEMKGIEKINAKYFGKETISEFVKQ